MVGGGGGGGGVGGGRLSVDVLNECSNFELCVVWVCHWRVTGEISAGLHSHTLPKDTPRGRHKRSTSPLPRNRVKETFSPATTCLHVSIQAEYHLVL